MTSKISKRLFRRLLGTVAALLTSILALTWKVERVNLDVMENELEKGPVVFAMFHEDILPLMLTHKKRRFAALTSLSADGEILSAALKVLGFGVLRGSTSKGAIKATREAIKGLIIESASPILAVDGPRGPRRVPQAGAVMIAAICNRPVICAAADVKPVILLKSWDRMKIPLPFSRIKVAYKKMPSPDLGKHGREKGLILLKEVLISTSQLASLNEPAEYGCSHQQ